MTWYYAAGGAQLGPVDDGQLDRLVEAGVVTGDTLVWHAGLDGWKPLREARTAALAPMTPPPSAGAAAWTQPRPRPDFEAEFARTIGRRVSPLASISRGMSLVMAKPGPTIGISALIIAMMIGAGFVPCVGSIVQIAVTGPLTAAWYGYFLRHIRGQSASMDDVFAVFSSPDLLHMIGVHLVVTAITVVLIVPFVLLVVFTTLGSVAATAAAANGDAPPFVMGPLALLPFLALLPVLAVLIYVTMAFMFAPALVLDRGHAFWPALRLSMKVVNRRLLPMIGLVVLTWLISLAGILALCLGIFVALPVVMASNAFTYEDLFGDAGAA